MHLGDKHKIILARELTKIYEQIISGIGEELLKYFEQNPDKIKGEFVVIVPKKLSAYYIHSFVTGDKL